MIALVTMLALSAPTDPDCLWVHGDGATFLGGEGLSDGFVVKGDTIVSAIGPRFEGTLCEDVDVSGRTVTPGLVAVGVQLGLVEVGAVAATRQADGGGGPVRASLQIADAYNPLSTLIPMARTGGVTHAIITPSGGTISGQAAAVQLAGDTQETAIVNASVAMVAHVHGNKAAALRDLGSLLDDTRLALRRRADVEAGRTRELAAHPRDLEALVPVVRGEVPLILGAHRASDIEAVLRFAQSQGIRVVLSGGAEAWRHASALAEASIPVMIDPMVYGPGGFDQIDARPDNAKLLVEAGVDVILVGAGTHNARAHNQLAGVAASNGMDRDAALASLTEVPARVFGLEGRGRLEVGASADFVVWRTVDGQGVADPLELTSLVDAIYIGGVPQSLHTRQDALRERYRELPGSPIQALSLP